MKLRETESLFEVVQSNVKVFEEKGYEIILIGNARMDRVEGGSTPCIWYVLEN